MYVNGAPPSCLCSALFQRLIWPRPLANTGRCKMFWRESAEHRRAATLAGPDVSPERELRSFPVPICKEVNSPPRPTPRVRCGWLIHSYNAKEEALSIVY